MVGRSYTQEILVNKILSIGKEDTDWEKKITEIVLHEPIVDPNSTSGTIPYVEFSDRFIEEIWKIIMYSIAHVSVEDKITLVRILLKSSDVNHFWANAKFKFDAIRFLYDDNGSGDRTGDRLAIDFLQEFSNYLDPNNRHFLSKAVEKGMVETTEYLLSSFYTDSIDLIKIDVYTLVFLDAYSKDKKYSYDVWRRYLDVQTHPMLLDLNYRVIVDMLTYMSVNVLDAYYECYNSHHGIPDEYRIKGQYSRYNVDSKRLFKDLMALLVGYIEKVRKFSELPSTEMGVVTKIVTETIPEEIVVCKEVQVRRPITETYTVLANPFLSRLGFTKKYKTIERETYIDEHDVVKTTEIVEKTVEHKVTEKQLVPTKYGQLTANFATIIEQYLRINVIRGPSRPDMINKFKKLIKFFTEFELVLGDDKHIAFEKKTHIHLTLDDFKAWLVV